MSMDSQWNPHDAIPTNMEASIAVLSVEMRVIREGVEELKNGQQRAVSRTEWEQRNIYTDNRFAAFDKELAARRVPWTSVGALIVAGSVLLLQIIERVGA